MMKKYILFFYLVFFAFFLNAQIKQENSLLWEISGNGLENPSFIYGTIHLIPENDFFFYDEWIAEFNKCDVLVLETDIEMSIAQQFSLLPKLKLPDKKQLSDFLTPQEYEILNDYLIDSLQISNNTYKIAQIYKPFFAYSLIINEVIEGKKIIYEQYLTDLAHKNKMKVISLEEMEFQLGLVDSISIEDQIKLFLYDFEKPQQTNILKEYNKTLTYYKNQDMNSMLQMEVEVENDIFMQNFLIKRNIDWIGKIKAIISKKTAFIAVGAAHLPGENGVLNLLKKEGYTIKPVYSKK